MSFFMNVTFLQVSSLIYENTVLGEIPRRPSEILRFPNPFIITIYYNFILFIFYFFFFKKKKKKKIYKHFDKKFKVISTLRSPILQNPQANDIPKKPPKKDSNYCTRCTAPVPEKHSNTSFSLYLPLTLLKTIKPSLSVTKLLKS
jgi:hypothetical protein